MADAVALERGLRLVGQRGIRHDARDKVMAATAYAGDWAMPGMLHGVVVRSPYPSARIRSLDTARASALPGVAIVLTARDVPRNTLWTDVPGQTTEVGPLRARLHGAAGRASGLELSRAGADGGVARDHHRARTRGGR